MELPGHFLDMLTDHIIRALKSMTTAIEQATKTLREADAEAAKATVQVKVDLTAPLRPLRP